MVHSFCLIHGVLVLIFDVTALKVGTVVLILYAIVLISCLVVSKLNAVVLKSWCSGFDGCCGCCDSWCCLIDSLCGLCGFDSNMLQSFTKLVQSV